MSGRLESLDDAERDAIARQDRPDWTGPMLATLSHEQFSDPDWVFERKFDGERCLAFGGSDGVRLLSRNRKPLNDTYPELVEALSRNGPDDYVADGEIVAFEGDTTSFSRLQQRIGLGDPDEARNSGVAVYFYLFDLMHLDGFDLTKLPLRRRKSLLQQAFDWHDPLRFSRHWNETGEDLYAKACREGWEGLIAKRADGRYRHSRSRDWLKFKCTEGQELVIGGFTPPQGSREVLGALLVGYYEDGRLRYAGKVGTGFDRDTLHDLGEKLDPIRTGDSPFAEDVGERDAIFVEPKLVGQFGFTEWTGDGKLRHPRFLGLRDDKSPDEVRRET